MMIREPQPAGRRGETEEDDHGGSSPVEAPPSRRRMAPSKSPNANANAPPTAPSKQINNGPRSSSVRPKAAAAAALPIAAEPTEPARANVNTKAAANRPIAAKPKEPARANANANSQPSNWIDRKTRRAKNGGERCPADRRPVNHSKKVNDDKTKSIVKGPVNHSKKVKDEKTKNVLKGDDYDVEKGDGPETPQECIMEILAKDANHEQDNPEDDNKGSVPGAFHVRGMDRQPSTSVLANNNDNGIGDDVLVVNNSPVNMMDLDAPLVAHLVEDDEPLYDNIVVAVEATKLKRRERLVVAVLLVAVFLLVGIVLTVTLIKKPWNNPGPTKEDLGFRVLDTIDGDEESEFGTSVSMCSDGSRVAIGAQGSDEVQFSRKPTVTVYQLDGKDEDGSRIQIGQNLTCSLPDILDSNTSMIRSRVVVELSSDCQVLAIGCPLSKVNNKTSVGIVKLYRYSSASKLWELEGNPNVINGVETSDMAGASLSLSRIGDRIAIGSPGHDWGETDAGQVRVFELNTGTWQIVGTPLNGTFPGEEFGGSVSLAANDQSDTDMMAVGSSSRRSILDTCRLTSALAFRNYEYVGGDWSPRGYGIVPQGFDIDTAWFVKLSSNGKRLVVSNLYLDKDGIGINENEGIYAAAFELDSQGKKWEPRGGNIHRSISGSKSGYMISLSDDGQRIAMGDPGKKGDGGVFSGHAHFYEFIGDRHTDGKWCQLGSKIEGANPGDLTGYSVSLSGNGTRMVIASPKSRALGYEHGQVMVVELQEGSIATTCDVETPPSSLSLITREGGSSSICNRSR